MSQVVVVFGSAQGFPPALLLYPQTLNGQNGFVINGSGTGTVITTGDFNNDGLIDLAFAGSVAGAYPEEVFVVFGQKTYPATISVASLNGVNGFTIRGNLNDAFGSALASGDLNGDGIPDLAIGAPLTPKVYVWYGSKGPFPAIINYSSLNGTNGFAVQGISNFDQMGTSLAIGDVNNDGNKDLVIGAPSGGKNAGAIYTIFGPSSIFPSNVNVSSLMDGKNGFMINGINPQDLTGQSLRNIADVNGDGIPDIPFGAPNAPYLGAAGPGSAYVVYGRPVFPATLNLAALSSIDGFIAEGVTPGDNTGSSLAIFDVNGDGQKDLMVGASNGGPQVGQLPGAVYALFGGKNIGNNNINNNNLVASSASRLDHPFSSLTKAIDIAWIAMGILLGNKPKEEFLNSTFEKNQHSQEKLKISRLNEPAVKMIEPAITLGTFALATLYKWYTKEAEQEKVLSEKIIKEEKEGLSKEVTALKNVFSTATSQKVMVDETKKRLDFLMTELEEDIEGFETGKTTASNWDTALYTKQYIENQLLSHMLKNKIV